MQLFEKRKTTNLIFVFNCNNSIVKFVSQNTIPLYFNNFISYHSVNYFQFVSEGTRKLQIFSCISILLLLNKISANVPFSEIIFVKSCYLKK